MVTTCAGFRIPADDDSLNSITRLALRELARRIQILEAQLDGIVTRLRRITATAAPDLLDRRGVGPDTAATLLITAVDNPDRLHHERALASLCGSAPVPANSGQTQNRHRLNRGGDRNANSALWRIAIVPVATDPDTQNHIASQLADGKTKSENIRCLKRYIAREVSNALPRAALA